jgi:acetyl esterase/lipase
VVGLVCRKADKGDSQAADPIDRESAVPSFQALVYAGPQGIRGEKITKENTPPTWILVGDEDGAMNWLVTHFQEAKKAGVSAELHVFAKTGHGFGYRPYKASGKPVEAWPTRFVEFLDVQGMVKK